MNKFLINCFIALCLIVTTFAQEREIDYENQNEFYQKLGAKCRNFTGDDNYFLKVVESLGKASDCGTETMKLHPLLITLNNAMMFTGNYTGLFKPACETKNEVFECITKGFSVFDPCFTEEEKTDKTKVLNTIHSIFDYLCIDDGDSLSLFFEKNGHVCVEENNRALSGCFETSLSHYQELPEILTTSYFLNDNTCNDIEKIKTCISTTMLNCNETVPTTFSNGLFTTALNALSCNEIINN